MAFDSTFHFHSVFPILLSFSGTLYFEISKVQILIHWVKISIMWIHQQAEEEELKLVEEDGVP